MTCWAHDQAIENEQEAPCTGGAKYMNVSLPTGENVDLCADHAEVVFSFRAFSQLVVGQAV